MYILTEETHRVASNNVTRLGYHLVGILTTHQAHLATVLGSKIENNGADNKVGIKVTYAVWTMNLDQGKGECLNGGFYGLEDLEAAYAEAISRIH